MQRDWACAREAALAVCMVVELQCVERAGRVWMYFARALLDALCVVQRNISSLGV